jgi:hypothetical protein
VHESENPMSGSPENQDIRIHHRFSAGGQQNFPFAKSATDSSEL